MIKKKRFFRCGKLLKIFVVAEKLDLVCAKLGIITSTSPAMSNTEEGTAINQDILDKTIQIEELKVRFSSK